MNVVNPYISFNVEPPPIEWVTIEQAGNLGDTQTGFGAVTVNYRISKFAIRESYIDLYNTATTPTLTGSDNRGDDKPATSISWNAAARFVNWLNAIEGEQVAYRFTTGGYNDNITLWDSADAWTIDGENSYRHKDCKYFLPSDDEWYKAAYYDGQLDVYYDYATGSDDAPGIVNSGTTTGTAVYSFRPDPADVNQAGGLSPYDTMGQSGNTWEWNESAYIGDNDSTTESRALRGGDWRSTSSDSLQSITRISNIPDFEDNDNGFRVAAVPDRTPALAIDWVTIGDPGNAADTVTNYGAVSYEYRISTYAIRESYIDAYNIAYPQRQLTYFNWGDDKPATSISWREAARFVNWLNAYEGYQPAYKFTGNLSTDNISLWTASDGGYDSSNRFRNSNAKYFLPSEDEWYKAAYYDPNYGGVGVGGYWDYPTGQDIGDEPTDVLSGTLSGTAVYNGANVTPTGPADVDNCGGLSPYGTMGQGGNVMEKLESAYDGSNGNATENRSERGGHFGAPASLMTSTDREPEIVSSGSSITGFRIASKVE